MWCVNERERTIWQFVIVKNKLMSVSMRLSCHWQWNIHKFFDDNVKPRPKIVGRNMLRAFCYRVAMCRDVLRPVGLNLTIFNLEPRTPNVSQHIATGWPNAPNICCTQQCCDMLRWHVTIVWPGLYTEFINQYHDRHKQNWRWFDNSSCSSEKRGTSQTRLTAGILELGARDAYKTGLKQCSLWTMHIMTSLSLDPSAIYELKFFIASW